MALKFSLERPIVIEEPKQKTGVREPVANQPIKQSTSDLQQIQNRTEPQIDGRFCTEGAINHTNEQSTSETPSQLILLADNGHLRVEVTYEDVARGTEDKLEQFKAALETLRILQSLHYGPTEEVDEVGNKVTWPPLPDRIKNGEAYLAQQKRVMGPDRERRVAEENCRIAEARLAELRAKVDELQAREDGEYDTMQRIEMELGGPGTLICNQCYSVFRIDQGCSCWRNGDGTQ